MSDKRKAQPAVAQRSVDYTGYCSLRILNMSLDCDISEQIFRIFKMISELAEFNACGVYDDCPGISTEYEVLIGKFHPSTKMPEMNNRRNFGLGIGEQMQRWVLTLQ